MFPHLNICNNSEENLIINFPEKLNKLFVNLRDNPTILSLSLEKGLNGK